MLTNIINSIKKIAQALLHIPTIEASNDKTSHHDNSSIIEDRSIEDGESKKETSVDQQHILVSQVLAEIVEQKRLQYISQNIGLEYSFDQTISSAFIYGNILNFERMMSNVINNAAEAFDGKYGIVKVGFSVAGNEVRITIQDDGKGMRQEIADKLMRGESVSTTKAYGHGIGIRQIIGTLKEFNGRQFIESTLGVGTKVTLIIPRVADVVILDDSKLLLEALSTFLQSRSVKKVDTYCSPNDLLKNLSKYSVDIKIFMDNDFRCDISGEDLVKQLTAQGFKNIFILSGSLAKNLRSKYPEGTIFIEKGSETFMDDLTCYATRSETLKKGTV